MKDLIYGIDFGGTNLRIGLVNSKTGSIVGNIFKRDITGVSSNEELESIIDSQITEKYPVGISAAGTVDEKRLIITKSPNSRIKGQITFGSKLRAREHYTTMTNDMKAAVQAAARFGEGNGFENVLLATYSSGFNCAVVRNGVNASTAEFGHLVYKTDGDLFCGCGEKGHLEIYVSGNGAAAMAKQFFNTAKTMDHPILESVRVYGKDSGNLGSLDLKDPRVHAMVVDAITAEDVYRAFSHKPHQEPQRTIRDTQVRAIATSFGMMTSAYNPLDRIVLMGSQTKDWSALFNPAILLYSSGGMQLSSLPKPSIVRTSLPEIGVQGAVAYHMAQRK